MNQGGNPGEYSDANSNTDCSKGKAHGGEDDESHDDHADRDLSLEPPGHESAAIFRLASDGPGHRASA
jgi:hypothetical protein